MGIVLGNDVYKDIEKYAFSQIVKSKDINHDKNHILRVRDNALKIVRLLKLENNIDTNLLKAICLLHDITYVEKKPSIYVYFFEGHIEKKIAQSVLMKFNLPSEMKDIIIDAVSRHTHSFPFKRLNRKRNPYVKILQDADTLDFFYCSRIKIHTGKSDKGVFKNIRIFMSRKLIEYGINNLAIFLNYPILAKHFFLDSSMKCV